jgi:hypothetical protein
MSFHRNAKLGLAGRYALVCAIEEGLTLKAAAAAFSVSPAQAVRPVRHPLPERHRPIRPHTTRSASIPLATTVSIFTELVSPGFHSAGWGNAVCRKRRLNHGLSSAGPRRRARPM